MHERNLNSPNKKKAKGLKRRRIRIWVGLKVRKRREKKMGQERKKKTILRAESVKTTNGVKTTLRKKSNAVVVLLIFTNPFLFDCMKYW